MALLKIHKVIELPPQTESDSIYYVESGNLFDMYISDNNGNIRKLNTGNTATMVKTTNLTITSTRKELPETPVSERKSIVIYNNSNSETVYIGDNTVTSTKGTPILPGRKEAYDIDSGLYGVCESGKTADITINEFV